MTPTKNLAETKTPSGSRFSLHEHDGDYFLKLNGRQLMSTTSIVSELMLSDLALDHVSPLASSRVLIGGLGLGFSLKQVLERSSKVARVEVAELLPEVVEWNRTFLQDVNGALLDDPRVTIHVMDVYKVIREASTESYDAILLDVDNGPTSFVHLPNSRLYDRHGLDLIRRVLKPKGRVAFWSACKEPGFFQKLARAGFRVEAFPAKAHERAKRAEHVIYVGERK